MPSSFSVMKVHPFEYTAQGALGIVQAGAYRADLTADDPRDFFIGHGLDVPEHQHLAVFRGQFVEGGVDALHVFRREVVPLPPARRSVNLFQRLERRAAFAEFAQGPVRAIR